MAAIMVYGMIVYNVALNTGGVTNATFVMALHEMPIMVPVAFVLEFFVVEKLATKLAFLFMRLTDRPQFITYAISLMIVCIMCPVMSLIATVLFKEPGFGKVDELGLPCVLTIEGAQHKIAETIVQNTAEKNQSILTLDSMQSTTSTDVANGTTYLSVMESNLDVLKQALN